MRLVPALSTKGLQEAAPGELLRVRLGDSPALCIAAELPQHDNRKILIVLDQGAPHYRMLREEPLTLSYGHGYEFIISPAARSTTAMTADFESAGAILVDSGRAMLRAAPMSPSAPSLLYEIATGTAGPSTGNLSSQIAILDWTLARSDAKDNEPPFIEFHAP
jgi:hypothetical protein